MKERTGLYKGIDPTCYRYLNMMALYHPGERGRLIDAFTALSDADAVLIDQCAIDTYTELKKIARARGVPLGAVKNELKNLMKRSGFPKRSDLGRVPFSRARSLVMQAYSNLGYPTPEAKRWVAKRSRPTEYDDAVAQLDDVPTADATFGKLMGSSKHIAHRIVSRSGASRSVSLFGWMPR